MHLDTSQLQWDDILRSELVLCNETNCIDICEKRARFKLFLLHCGCLVTTLSRSIYLRVCLVSLVARVSGASEGVSAARNQVHETFVEISKFTSLTIDITLRRPIPPLQPRTYTLK